LMSGSEPTSREFGSCSLQWGKPYVEP
jgi:hypothetical protein